MDVKVTVRGGFGAGDAEFTEGLWVGVHTKGTARKQYINQVLRGWELITGAQWTLMEPHLVDNSDLGGNEKYIAFTCPNPINGHLTAFFFLREGLDL